MRKQISTTLGALLAGLGLAGAAPAALVPTLSSITQTSSGNIFTYNVTLTGDEGMSTSAPNPSSNSSFGTRFVIYDFGAYIAGSVFSGNPLFTATAEQTTTGAFGPPGFIDNSSLYNLVFTYNGPDFQTTGGPYPDRSEGLFGARSGSLGTVTSAFGSVAVKNTGVPTPNGTAGTAAFNQGSVLVAAGAIPESSTWAMMIVGFGAVGGSMRRRRRTVMSFG